MIEITLYARRYRTMKHEGPRGCFPGSERSGHPCLNPVLNSAAFEGSMNPPVHTGGFAHPMFLNVSAVASGQSRKSQLIPREN